MQQFPTSFKLSNLKIISKISIGRWSILQAIYNFLKNHSCVTDKPDVTLTLADKDLVDLMTGKLNPQKAFFQGKLKVQGNMGLAMKLQEFQKQAGEVMKSKL